VIPALTELISKFKFAGIIPTCRGYSSKFRLPGVTAAGYRWACAFLLLSGAGRQKPPDLHAAMEGMD